ncbi:MAG: hypothetical protein E6J36_05585 [Chloroflexi bacterium]|nr:MAG: hypothetical protein E6J36_05585 [Chloroflexota bacterium]TMD70300.1 MAG: hypothetical protein E6I97_19990 [Chloroflexota bacterium]
MKASFLTLLLPEDRALSDPLPVTSASIERAGEAPLAESAARCATRGKTMHEVLILLGDGDRRSIGNVDAVIAAVEHDPSCFDVLFHSLFSDDPLIRMRSADAIEKISRKHPDWLQPYKRQLLTQVAQSEQQEVRWHVAQLFPRLAADQHERTAMVRVLLDYLNDPSQIVKVCALQALADLSAHDPVLRRQTITILEQVTEIGSPAVKSRGRKLLQQLTTQSPHR